MYVKVSEIKVVFSIESDETRMIELDIILPSSYMSLGIEMSTLTKLFNDMTCSTNAHTDRHRRY
jgi:hypothetical protein